MKKSRFYVGNIVKKSYKTFNEPIVFFLGDQRNKIEEYVVKENALLYKINGRFVDVDDIQSNFDLICEYIAKNYFDTNFFESFGTFSYDLETPYIDEGSLTRYYSKEHNDEGVSLAKVKSLAIKDPTVNMVKREKKR